MKCIRPKVSYRLIGNWTFLSPHNTETYYQIPPVSSFLKFKVTFRNLNLDLDLDFKSINLKWVDFQSIDFRY